MPLIFDIQKKLSNFPQFNNSLYELAVTNKEKQFKTIPPSINQYTIMCNCKCTKSFYKQNILKTD